MSLLIIGVGLGWFASWTLVVGAFGAGIALAILLKRRHP
jgi:hypothetical protein